MPPEAITRLQIQQDLKSQAYEHCRKILIATERMILAETAWKRDQFYVEAMRHFALGEQMLGEWRVKISIATE